MLLNVFMSWHNIKRNYRQCTSSGGQGKTNHIVLLLLCFVNLGRSLEWWAIGLVWYLLWNIVVLY